MRPAPGPVRRWTPRSRDGAGDVTDAQQVGRQRLQCRATRRRLIGDHTTLTSESCPRRDRPDSWPPATANGRRPSEEPSRSGELYQVSGQRGAAYTPVPSVSSRGRSTATPARGHGHGRSRRRARTQTSARWGGRARARDATLHVLHTWGFLAPPRTSGRRAAMGTAPRGRPQNSPRRSIDSARHRRTTADRRAPPEPFADALVHASRASDLLVLGRRPARPTGSELGPALARVGRGRVPCLAGGSPHHRSGQHRAADTRPPRRQLTRRGWGQVRHLPEPPKPGPPRHRPRSTDRATCGGDHLTEDSLGGCRRPRRTTTPGRERHAIDPYRSRDLEGVRKPHGRRRAHPQHHQREDAGTGTRTEAYGTRQQQPRHEHRDRETRRARPRAATRSPVGLPPRTRSTRARR